MRLVLLAASIVVAVVVDAYKTGPLNVRTRGPLNETELLRWREIAAECPPGRFLAVRDCNSWHFNTCSQRSTTTLKGCRDEVYCACPVVTLVGGACGEWSDCRREPSSRSPVPELALALDDVALVTRHTRFRIVQRPREDL